MLQATLQSGSPRDLGDWMVWTSPWPQWKPLIEAPLLIAGLGTDPTVQIPREKRRFERFPAQWRVLFPFEGRVFRTTTVNVSQGGFYALNPLPDSFIRKEVDVLISPPSSMSNVRTTARIVAASDGAVHFGFLDAESEAAKKLADWLKRMIEKKAA